MKFIAYGLNHRTAPIAVREKYALNPEQVGETLRGLKELAPQAVFLSTCNRVEFYFATDQEKEALETIHCFLFKHHRLKPKEISRYFYHYEGPEAFLHLFRVASSLDSMVLGEAQILGQVKEAYETASAVGTLGSTLNGIFHRAFSAAKRVRSQTEIARMPTNVSSVAVDLAGKIFSPLAQRQVLLIGAGEMSELTAKYLYDAGVRGFRLANRTLDKAKALAAPLGGKALTLEDALFQLHEVDIILTSVSGAKPLLTRERLEEAMHHREGNPLFIIDTGVPRNVEESASQISSLYLYNIDDLSQLANHNRDERQKASQTAEAILKEEVEKLCSWLNTLELVPTVVKLRDKYEKVRLGELEEFFKKNPALGEKERKAVEKLTHDLVGKLLHEPTVNLKAVTQEIDRFEYARMLSEIFALFEEPKND
jgi:glutamyl-tRNA reductase